MHRDTVWRQPREDGGGDWWDAAASQGEQRLRQSAQARKRKGDLPGELLEAAWPCWLLTLRTVTAYSAVALSYPVCGTLLQQPWKTNAIAFKYYLFDSWVFWYSLKFCKLSALLYSTKCWLCPLIYPFVRTEWEHTEENHLLGPFDITHVIYEWY